MHGAEYHQPTQINATEQKRKSLGKIASKSIIPVKLKI